MIVLGFTFSIFFIDEVESLTAARKVALNGSEPSDSIRVVNAVLTQIDKLRSRSNVLIMATSNITEIIGKSSSLLSVLCASHARIEPLSLVLDSAFLDRADLIQFIGRPSQNAVYAILVSCFRELMRVHLIEPTVSGWVVSVKSNFSLVTTFYSQSMLMVMLVIMSF